jgi:hypothetical protein
VDEKDSLVVKTLIPQASSSPEIKGSKHAALDLLPQVLANALDSVKSALPKGKQS